MTEKLVLENFAGIDQIEILLEEINIIIGPQASGKSICAKMLYFFKSIFRSMLLLYDKPINKRQFESSILKKFEEYFPPRFLGPQDFKITYFLNENSIEITRTNGKSKVTYSEMYVKQLPYLRSIYKKDQGKYSDDQINNRDIGYLSSFFEIRNSYWNNLSETIGARAAYSQNFIPAGRSFFALLQSNIFTFLSSSRAVDPFLIEFGSFYEQVKDFSQFRSSELRNKKERIIFQDIANINKEILHGTYSRTNHNDYLIQEDGRKISLANSSSGQQELLPLTLILSMLPFKVTGNMGSTIYIEEPEAHIFPDAQKKVIDLIAYLYNIKETPLQFIITTHSPYILTSINNLIYAGTLGMNSTKQTKKKINSLISEKLWLNTKNICAYSLHNGKCDCIKDKNSGLIDSEFLDSVSNDLGRVFDELIELS